MSKDTQQDNCNITYIKNITTYPNLGKVIQASDVSQKGGGSYKADYVNWCRTSHLLHEHAPGWQFHIATKDGEHVFKAPDGTAYVVGYFKGPNDQLTPEFPQAIMDNRNNAIQYEKVSARDLTDSHRRCLCTAAAAQFGLAWQLWAREELENPHREDKSHKPTPNKVDVDYTQLKSNIEKYKNAIESCESYDGLKKIYEEINTQGEELRKHLRNAIMTRKEQLKPREEAAEEEEQ